MPRLTETRASRTRLPPDGQLFIWCSEISGFGCRILPSGVRSWIVQLRYQGKSYRITLGPVGVLPFEGPEHAPGASDLAKIALNAARRGQDPRVAIGRARHPHGATLAEVWKAYGNAGYPLLNGIGFKRRIQRQGRRLSLEKPAVSPWRIGPQARSTTVEVQRWLDTIPGLGARSHALIQLKSLFELRSIARPCRHAQDRHHASAVATGSKLP